MEAVPAGDFIFDFEVAGETLLRHNLLAAAVAFRTIGNSFQVSVHRRERSGRNLRENQLRGTERRGKDNERYPRTSSFQNIH